MKKNTISKLWDCANKVSKRHESLRHGTIVVTMWFNVDTGPRVDMQFCPGEPSEYEYLARHDVSVETALGIVENGFTMDDMYVIGRDGKTAKFSELQKKENTEPEKSEKSEEQDTEKSVFESIKGKCKAQITDGFDGNVIEEILCDNREEASKWIEKQATEKYAMGCYKKYWWCTEAESGTVVDFGSYVYFGRVVNA